jgi:hypothetical protein
MFWKSVESFSQINEFYDVLGKVLRESIEIIIDKFNSIMFKKGVVEFLSN